MSAELGQTEANAHAMRRVQRRWNKQRRKPPPKG